MIRSSLILSASAVVVLTLAGCSDGGSGATTPTSTTSGNTGSSSASSSDPLATLDPCSLLSTDDVSQLGLTPQGPKEIASSRGCTWSKGATYVIGVHFVEGQGLDKLNDGTGQNTAFSLPSHDAVRSDKGSGCTIEIAITSNSTVDIQASEGAQAANECPLAQQYATLIEPKLPAQQK